MNEVPTRCVVDTNVAATANGANPEAGVACMAASGRALHSVMASGHVFIDTLRLIMREYQSNLRAAGQPGVGDAFLKWMLTNEWNGSKVTRVAITPTGKDDDFRELPAVKAGIRIDPSDRKFIAVAAAHPEHPPILQSFDSKWWGWREALESHGVTIIFLCPQEIQAKYRQKMGSP